MNGKKVFEAGAHPASYKFAEDGGKKAETDAHRRFEIRKTRRGMSFVRAGRGIETVDVFRKSVKDEAKGLGHWPLLQSYAYHWGSEVQFDPALDEVFGITNDKQRVRPIEDLWRLFVAVGVDEQLRLENNWQNKLRKNRPAPTVETPDEPTPAERAAASAESIGRQRTRVADHDKPKAREDFEAEAQRRSAVNQTSIDEARKAMEQEAKKRPYGCGTP